MSISALGASGTAPLQPMPAPVRDAGPARGVQVEGREPMASASANPSEPTAAPQSASATEVRSALDEVEKAIAPITQALEFSVDDDSGKTVVKVMDTETKELIRQMPSEEVLAIAKALDKLKGLLLQQQA